MKCRSIILAAVLGAMATGHARGQSCTVASTALAFGTYQPINTAAATSTATVTVTCNPGLVSLLMSYSIALGAGGGGSFAARGMVGGASRLGYQIYTNALLSQVWGDGTGGSSAVNDGYTLGLVAPVTRIYTAYGRIPGGQNVPPAAYTDVITILLSY